MPTPLTTHYARTIDAATIARTPAELATLTARIRLANLAERQAETRARIATFTLAILGMTVLGVVLVFSHRLAA